MFYYIKLYPFIFRYLYFLLGFIFRKDFITKMSQGFGQGGGFNYQAPYNQTGQSNNQGWNNVPNQNQGWN